MHAQAKNDELWYLIGKGVLSDLIDTLLAITDLNARALLWNSGVAEAEVARDCWLNPDLAYVPSPEIRRLLVACIATPLWKNPHQSEEGVPNVQDASVSGGDMLLCTDPGENWTVYVFQWTGTQFILLGPLADNATPGPGEYVLVIQATGLAGADQWGLPSLLLTTTA